MPLFTPQLGDEGPEILNSEERRQAIADMLLSRTQYPKLDMAQGVIQQLTRRQTGRMTAYLPSLPIRSPQT